MAYTKQTNEKAKSKNTNCLLIPKIANLKITYSTVLKLLNQLKKLFRKKISVCFQQYNMEIPPKLEMYPALLEIRSAFFFLTFVWLA